MPDSSTDSNDVLETIEKQSYYHGLLPKEDVRIILDKNGDFLVRSSEANPGEVRQYTLSVLVNKDLDDAAAVKHFVITCKDHKHYINSTESFHSIHKLVTHFQKSNQEVQDGIKILNPVRRQFWELDHESITLKRKLGEGAFGEVSMGTMKFKKGGKVVQVAVKQAKTERLTKEKFKEFMLEARNMRKLGHMNIIKFYGVAVMQEPIYLVMELAANGALDAFLKKNEELPKERRYEMLLQVAWGLEYIHGKPMLHRDIAARNCLYGDGKVKISDFGLTRSGTFYQMSPGMKAPVRWSAVETMKSQIYTQKTDVWSYGILALEIFNNGAEPYPGLTTGEVLERVIGGYRMPQPDNLNIEVSGMMQRCTSENPNDRPTIPEIAIIMQRVTGISRPNFVQIAKREAEELLIMNSMTQRRSRSKSSHSRHGSHHSHHRKNTSKVMMPRGFP